MDQHIPMKPVPITAIPIEFIGKASPCAAEIPDLVALAAPNAQDGKWEKSGQIGQGRIDESRNSPGAFPTVPLHNSRGFGRRLFSVAILIPLAFAACDEVVRDDKTGCVTVVSSNGRIDMRCPTHCVVQGGVLAPTPGLPAVEAR